MTPEVVSAVSAALSTVAAAVSLIVAWKSVDIAAKARTATEKQASIAAETRREMIRPHVAIYTRNYVENSKNIYLFIENVEVGSALDVEVRLLDGKDFDFTGGMPLCVWRPIERGLEILRPKERFWTLLLSYTRENEFKDTRIIMAASYKDIEGYPYQTEPVQLELLPNGGALWSEMKRERNGEVVSHTIEKPFEP